MTTRTTRSVRGYRRLAPEGDADIARMIIDDLDDGLQWLTEHGLDLTTVPSGMGPGRVFGGRRIRPDPVSGAVTPLVKALASAGGQLRTQARCLDLRLDTSGSVRG